MWAFCENWIRMEVTDSVVASAYIEGCLFLLRWSLLLCLPWCWRDEQPYLSGPNLNLSASNWLCYQANQMDAFLRMSCIWAENPDLPLSLLCTPSSGKSGQSELLGLVLIGLLASLSPSRHWLILSSHSALIGHFQESLLLRHFLSITSIEILCYFSSAYRIQHVPFVSMIKKIKYPCALYASSVSDLDLLINHTLPAGYSSSISHVAFLLRYHYMIFHILLYLCAYCMLKPLIQSTQLVVRVKKYVRLGFRMWLVVVSQPFHISISKELAQTT